MGIIIQTRGDVLLVLNRVKNQIEDISCSVCIIITFAGVINYQVVLKTGLQGDM